MTALKPGDDPAVPQVPSVPGLPSTPPGSKPTVPTLPSVPPATAAVPVPSAQPGTTVAPTVAGEPGGLGLPLVGLLLVVALGVGVVVGLLVRRATRPQADPPPATRPKLPGTQSGGADLARLHAEWTRERARADGLAEALVDVRDRVDNPALTERIGAALERGGWFVIDPTDAPFDPNAQHAIDREPTDDPALDGTVAVTERLGYQDLRGTVLRTPEVVVRRYSPPTAGSSQ